MSAWTHAIPPSIRRAACVDAREPELAEDVERVERVGRARAERLDTWRKEGGMKILAVDDDALCRHVLRQALSSLGHDVNVAANGAAAWQFLTMEEPRVVVSDWNMPEVDGLELVRRIRARPGAAYTYFILLTAQGDTEALRSEAIEAGIDDFLPKPLNVDELSRRLRVAERILQHANHPLEPGMILPICSYCQRVRDEQDQWQRSEAYWQTRVGVQFSHAICPGCYEAVVLPQLKVFSSDLPKGRGLL